ncbi:hypothetical protein FRC10_010248 [Ceratobasidium sp. 414]|nr:hypothetical protein FRC10_010248 [Ceratobasidium sp. 414]
MATTLDANIPQQDRLSRRIESLLINPPDTEYSSYGPIDSLLDLYFPFAGFWMLKPQAAVRELVLGHGSTDSTGRNVNPNGRQVKRADFIVARFSASGRGDAVSLVVEVKPRFEHPNSHAFTRSLNELSNYMKQLNDGLAADQGGEGNMRALLLMGTICFSYQMVGRDVVGAGDLPVDGADLRSPEFRTFLLERVENAPPVPAE